MKYQFISDCHLHSLHSFDGKDSVMMIAERACQLNFYAVTITDHCECQEYFSQNVRSSMERSIRDTAKARALYHDRLRILTGIELGQPTQDEEAAKDALALDEYDFVLGSLHNLRGEQDFYFLEYTPENTAGLLDRYFQEMLELARTDYFDSLAHLTYPLRYAAGREDIVIERDHYQEQIDAILSVLAEHDKALEVNTSGLRQLIGKTLPDEPIIRRFRELGGKYVTLGSDAHRWGDVGAGIEEGLALLQKCGFTHFTVFEKRRPKLLPI